MCSNKGNIKLKFKKRLKINKRKDKNGKIMLIVNNTF